MRDVTSDQDTQRSCVGRWSDDCGRRKLVSSCSKHLALRRLDASISRIIYRLMRREILHLQGIPPEIDELAAEAIEEAEEGAPLLGHHNESRARYDGSSA